MTAFEEWKRKTDLQGMAVTFASSGWYGCLAHIREQVEKRRELNQAECDKLRGFEKLLEAMFLKAAVNEDDAILKIIDKVGK